MNRSSDSEFDIWLRQADQDLLNVIGSETDVEAMLTNAKRRGARSGLAVPTVAEPTAGDQRPEADSGKRLWTRLSGPERAALVDAGFVRTWQPGEILAMQGSPPSSMFVILHGWVRITATNYRGDNAPLAARGPTEIVGELAPISGLPRTATIQAIDEVRALVILRERLLAVLRRKPRISEELLRTAAIRLQQSARLQLESSGPDFPQRLAAVLLELALRYDPDWEAASEVVLNVTQGDLASHARVSRSTMVRGLEELKKLGVVQTGRHRVTIVRQDVLRDLAAGRPLFGFSPSPATARITART